MHNSNKSLYILYLISTCLLLANLATRQRVRHTLRERHLIWLRPSLPAGGSAAVLATSALVPDYCFLASACPDAGGCALHIAIVALSARLWHWPKHWIATLAERQTSRDTPLAHWRRPA